VRIALVLLASVAVIVNTTPSTGLGATPQTSPSQGRAAVPTPRSDRALNAPAINYPQSGSAIPGDGHPRIATIPLARAAVTGLPEVVSWLTFDPAVNAFFIAAPPSSVDVVTIASDPVDQFAIDYQVVTNVTVGTDPFAVAYDNATGKLFVTNSGSNNVSVLQGNQSSPVGSIGTGMVPLGVAYDPLDDDVYVANSANANVTVIAASNLTVVANIDVGSDPVGVAVDSGTGDIFVADNGSDQVSVISGTTNRVFATLAVGDSPRDIAIDNATGEAFVTNEGSPNVSVISISTLQVVASISVSGYQLYLDGIVYDWQDGLLWVGAGQNAILVLDPTARTEVSSIFYDPAGIAFDPLNGDVCATNSANRTFACVLLAEGAIDVGDVSNVFHSVWLNFTATGLSRGTSWNITLDPFGPSLDGFPGEQIDLQVLPNWSYPFSVGVPPGYTANVTNGTATVGESNLQVEISFSAPPVPTYPVTVNETGLPPGWGWLVGVTVQPRVVEEEYSNSASITLNLTNGSYPYYLASAYGTYAAPNGAFLLNGSGINVTVRFTEVTFAVNFTERGLPDGTQWSVRILGAGSSTSTASSMETSEPNGSYSFSAWSSNPSYGALGGSFDVNGAPTNVSVNFVRVTFLVNFTESGLPERTEWEVQVLGGIEVTSSSATLEFTEPNGTYAYSISTSNEHFQAYPSRGNVTVQGAPVYKAVEFSPYFVANFTEGSEFTGSCDPFTVAVPLTATASKGDAPYNFSWGFGPGAPLQYGISIGHTYSAAGTYNVTLWVVDSARHNETITQAIVAPSSPGCPTPVAVTPLGGSLLVSGVAAALVVAAAVVVVLLRHRTRKREVAPPSNEPPADEIRP
jgi:YVTN family beta-propeller protein